MISQASAIIEPAKRLTVGPLHNEMQETMFDTELSQAVDDLVIISRFIKKAKEVKASCEMDLIKIMKKNCLDSVRFDGGQITIEEKSEKIKIKLDEGFEPQEA